MNKKPVYLKSNVVLEPLIDNWYAWPHLIAPATYGLNLKNRHLPILDSYISNPELHEIAVQDPKMLGGPFMEFRKERMESVVTHRRKLESDNEDLLGLANDLLALNNILQSHKKGACLESLYMIIPESLKGCVELFYDINDAPSYRIFEPFLYKSIYFRKTAQSFKFYEISEDERTFVLSTPRIHEGGFYLNIPFDDERVDYLYQTVTTPRDFDELVSVLEIAETDKVAFRQFFTTNAPATYGNYTGDDIRIRYFGHACILVETKEISILIDPVISYDYESYISRFTYKDLPDLIDYVMITHNHQDHILLETMLKLRHKVKNIIVPRSTSYLQDPSLKHMLNFLGFKNVISMDEFEEINYQGVKMVGVPFLGEHSDLNIRCKMCYLVEISERKVLFAADTKNISPEVYDRVAALYGKIDVLFLGLECDGAPLSWFYGPLLPKHPARDIDFTRTLAGSNFEEGRNIIKSLDPSHLFVYAMGQEPWLNYIMAIKYTDESRPIINAKNIIKYCHETGRAAEILFGEREIRLESAPNKTQSFPPESMTNSEFLSGNFIKVTI